MDLYTLYELIRVVETIVVPKTHFLDTYFKVEHLSDKLEIYFDDVFEGQVTLAPFVIPTSAGKPQNREDYRTKSFMPAYVKPLDNILPGESMTRMAGEVFGGEMTAMDRHERRILTALARQKLQIVQRWEWMAQMAIINSQMTISGDNYPTRLIDFGRSGNNTKVVSLPAAKWSNVDHDIKGDLEEWSKTGSLKCGTPLTDVYVSQELWKHMRANKGVKEEMDLTTRNTSTVVGSPTAHDPQNPVIFKGYLGEFAIYVHNGSYRDVDGVTYRYLAADEICMVAPVGVTGTEGVYGVRGFGLIQDKKAGLQALPIFPKVHEQDEPSLDQVISQSAPLMFPGRPDGTFKAKGLIDV